MPPLPESKLDSILEKIMACWGIPGMAVGIVKEQQIVYAKGFGAKKPGNAVPRAGRFNLRPGLHRKVFCCQRRHAAGRARQN